MKKQLTIGAFIVIALIGTTYYIQDLEEKTGCRRGWDYIDNGEFKGYYGCTTNSGVRYETCFDVYNSVNTENYWCKKGIRVESPKISSNQPTKGDWICPKRLNPCVKNLII